MEVLGSRFQGWNLLTQGIKISVCRKRQEFKMKTIFYIFAEMLKDCLVHLIVAVIRKNGDLSSIYRV